ncbi:MAG: tetratricopeptide repeat protein, partial [Planctomycetes bacterium]|nr:tetratricopeptide repeat protein [Planctomycetota bacterium]
LQLKIALTQKKFSNIHLDADPDQQVTQELDELMDIQIERHRQALKDNPHRADLYYRYGMLLRGQGNTEGAISNYQKAVEINPSYFKARIKLGLSLREAGEKQQGLAELQAALELKPEYAELHYKLGVMYCDKMQYALAVEQLELMLPEHEENGDIQSNLALALQNMGLIDRALANWQAVCELEPESAMAFQAQRSLPVLNPTL